MYQFPDADDVMGDQEPEPLQNSTRYKIIIIANLLLTLFIIAAVWFFFFFDTTTLNHNTPTPSSITVNKNNPETLMDSQHATGDFTPIITDNTTSEITTISAIPTITPPIKKQENTLSAVDRITQELTKNKQIQATKSTDKIKLTNKNQIIIEQKTELPLEQLINKTKQNLNNFDQHLVNKLNTDDKTTSSLQHKSRNTALNNSITFEKANDVDQIMAAMGDIKKTPEEKTIDNINNTVKRLLKNKESILRTTDTYEQKLLPETAENKKESRIITVKQGEKLWDIAVRAYGDGNQYKLILQANPLLKNNPELIKAGTILRAPLIDYLNKSK
jgi:nucleoid-associated protein YgaU